MQARHWVPAVALVLLLPDGLAYAQRARSGGGGVRMGGGSAVARGGGGISRPMAPRSLAPRSFAPTSRVAPARASVGGRSYARPGAVARGGGVAPYRHPRAGTGSGSYGYWGGHRGYHGKPYYGHGYYPYRHHYGYRPYYPYYGSPYFYGSVYWGWPYYSTPYYPWPYYASVGYADSGSRGGDVYILTDDDDEPPPQPAAEAYRSTGPRPSITLQGEPAPGEWGSLRLEVRPEDTSIYVDDVFRGTAADTKRVSLPPGRHVVELVRPGHDIERREVDVVKGERLDVLVELKRP
jgi:hypothetical protein